MKRKPLFIVLTICAAAIVIVLVVLFIKEPVKEKAKPVHVTEEPEEPEIIEPLKTENNG